MAQESPNEVVIGKASQFIGEITLSVPVGWFSPGWSHPAKTELMARALVLAQDRFNQGGLVVMASVVGEGILIRVQPHEKIPGIPARAFPDMMGLCHELEQIPLSGSCLCPCGCVADLAIRECMRSRLQVSGGVVCLSPPAFAVRDAAHPTHKGHGVQGWSHVQRILPPDITPEDAPDPYNYPYPTTPPDGGRQTVIQCGCGETLMVDFVYAVQEGMDKASSSDVVAKGVAKFYVDEDERRRLAREEREHQHRVNLASSVWSHHKGYPPSPEDLAEVVKFIREYEQQVGSALSLKQAIIAYRKAHTEPPPPQQAAVVLALARQREDLAKAIREHHKAFNSQRALDVHNRKADK